MWHLLKLNQRKIVSQFHHHANFAMDNKSYILTGENHKMNDYT